MDEKYQKINKIDKGFLATKWHFIAFFEKYFYYFSNT
jgi:hypothetical protein